METKEYELMDRVEQDHFWFIAKRRYLSVVLDKYFSQGGKMLDVGCGTGAVMESLKNRGDISGVDMSDAALTYCRQKGLKVEKGLANAMTYSESTFDIVFALDVLEHLDNPVGAVKEISRVLKDDGLFIATVPAHQWLWSHHDESMHHKKRYSKQVFAELFKGDFDILVISWIHSFILLPVILVRLLRNILKSVDNDSDVKEPSPVINKIMSLVYSVEIALFKVFYYLPFGLSLLVVAKKRTQIL